MPVRAPRLCSCGNRVPSGGRCPCEVKRTAERKAPVRQDQADQQPARLYRRMGESRKAFLRRHPRCAFCGDMADLVDHKIPHRGDQELFWDQDNWQPLCTPCHSGAKQRQERRQLHEVKS